MSQRLLTTLVLYLGCTVQAAAQSTPAAAVAYREQGNPATTTGTVLTRTVSVDITDVPVVLALDRIAFAVGTSITLSGNDPTLLARRVSIHVKAVTAGDALARVLAGTQSRVELSAAGNLLIVDGSHDGDLRVPPSGGSILRGRVVDARNGAPIPLASVELDSSSRTTTLDNGTYLFAKVSRGIHLLHVRRLGYLAATRSLVVDSDTASVDLVLSPSEASLERIVTTATGEQQRRAVGNLIETLPADSIAATAPITSLSDILTARVAGVQVFGDGGLSGASPDINMRGQNSFTVSNIPLLYIDGVRVDNSTLSVNANSASGQPLSGRFNDLNPDEIESIEVVKGPSAATLYGTDAANGAILVKTKQGSAGAPRWSFTTEQGIVSLDRSIFPLNYYAWGHTTDPSHSPTECVLTALASGSCVQDSITSFSPLRDPTLSPIGEGARTTYNLQVSGGIPSVRYFVAGGYQGEVAPVRLDAPDRAILESERGGAGLESDNIHPNAYDKYDGHGTVAANLSSDIDLSLSSSVQSNNLRVPSEAFWGSAATGVGYDDQNAGYANSNQRPAAQFAIRSNESVTRLTEAATANWRPSSWFSGHATGGFDFSSNYYDELDRAGEGPSYYQTGFRTNEKINTSVYSADLGATASLPLGSNIDTKTSFGGQYTRNVLLDNVAQAQALLPGSITLAGGSSTVVGETTTETKVAGAYAEERLGLNNRFFVTGGLRADGGSTFGSDFKAALYPKASASWSLGDEPFFPHIPGVSSVRLRAAYGESGVQPTVGAAIASIKYEPAWADGGSTVGARIQNLGDSNLEPERQRELEGGADLDLFHGRFHLEATYYDKESSNALVTIPLSPSLGVGGGTATEQINAGQVQNRGFEFLASARVIDSRALSWELALNGSHNRNKLVKLAPGVDSLTTYNGLALRPDYPLFAAFDLPYTFRDVNGDGIIEPNEVHFGANPVFMGPTYPPTQVTLSTTVGLFASHLRLSALLDHREGFREYEGNLYNVFSGGAAAVTEKSAPLSRQAAAVALEQEFSLYGFDDYVSFTRLREISVALDLPEVVPHALRARSVTLVLAARNVALWSSFRGIDPETQGTGDGGRGTLANGAYSDTSGPPPSQYWVARINVAF